MSIEYYFMDDFCKMSNGWLKELYNSESKMIYHYTSQDVLLSILRNQSLRFSDRFYLNDKTEGIYTLNLVIDNLDEIISDDSRLAPNKDRIKNDCQDYLKDFKDDRYKVYQCSFSLDNDCLPMWNYYTKNNELQGVNIGFNSDELAKSIDKNIQRSDMVDEGQRFVLGGTVVYNKAKQIEIIKGYVAEYERLVGRETPDIPLYNRQAAKLFKRVLDRIVLAGTFFKAGCFSFEHEYRLAVSLYNEGGTFEALKDKKVEYISRNNFYMPYIDLSFDLPCIRSVALSPTYNFENMKDNVQAMLRNFGVSDDVEIVQSQIPVRY